MAHHHDSSSFGGGAAAATAAENDGECEGALFPTEPVIEVPTSSLFRVATYNVLSSSLCSPADFTACAPENLHPSNRLPRIKAKLEEEIKCNAIICLQEVSRTWDGLLQVFFSSHGYQFSTSLYGKPFSDYMGVGIAWPRSLELLDLRTVRVSDTRPRLPRGAPPGWLQMAWGWWGRLKGLLITPPVDPWAAAMDRYNTMMIARLRSPESWAELVVGNYHMPCMFDQPQVMVIHAALCAQVLMQASGPSPHVLAGDFNFKPGDAPYRLIVDGSLPSDDPAVPPPLEGDRWSPRLPHSLVSAYVALEGAEPPFTNYNQFRKSPVFKATLDFIFCSPDIEVMDVLPPLPADTPGPFPTAEEPSDHVMIAATLHVAAAGAGEKKEEEREVGEKKKAKKEAGKKKGAK